MKLGGAALIGGTSYNISGGRTLVNATGYDISFARYVTVIEGKTSPYPWTCDTYGEIYQINNHNGSPCFQFACKNSKMASAPIFTCTKKLDLRGAKNVHITYSAYDAYIAALFFYMNSTQYSLSESSQYTTVSFNALQNSSVELSFKVQRTASGNYQMPSLFVSSILVEY